MPSLDFQRFECRGCARCCRELTVHLTPRDRKLIDEQGWHAKLIEPPYVKLGRNFVLNHRPGQGCVFLTPEGQCQIHLEYGATEKPLACQLYPFTLDRDEEGLRGSIRFDCPTVARNGGTVLSGHQSHLKRLGRELAEVLDGGPVSASIVQGRKLSPEALNGIVATIDGWLADRKRPLKQRLHGLHDLIQTLDRAKLSHMEDKEISQLVSMLMLDMPNVTSAADPIVASPPTERQLKLFRLTVFTYCESISFEQATASWFSGFKHRFKQLRRGRQMMSGQGRVPSLGPRMESNTFDCVERVSIYVPSAQESFDELTTRYLRARLLTHAAFGPAFYDWSMVDGLRALLLSVAVAGWLVRYMAARDNRSVYGIEDMVQAIGLMDRGAGRSPELGTRSALLRQRYIDQDDGIRKLIHTYPIVN